MNIFQKLALKAGGLSAQQIAQLPLINLYNYRTGAQQQLPISMGQPASYPKGELITYINAYQRNASVYTVVSMIARKFGYLPRYVYKIDNPVAAKNYQRYVTQKDFKYKHAIDLRRKAYSEDEVDPTNPVSLLLNRPNPQYGQDSFFELAAIYRLLCGECFIWLNRGDRVVYGAGQGAYSVQGNQRYKMPVLDMWILPSQFMVINVDRAEMMGDITSYTFLRNGINTYIPKEDVIHWKTPNPNYDAFNFQHLHGISPLEAGIRLITGDDAAMDAMVSMYQNGGTKGVLTNQGPDGKGNKLTPEQESAMKSAIDSKINNRSLKGAIAALPGIWNYLAMGENAVDMDLMEAQDMMTQKIANLYGVNYNLIKSGGTFDNLEQARKDFITQVVMPMACSLRDEMNKILFPAFGQSPAQWTSDVDITSLPELQDDMGKLVSSLMNADWMTPNEKRRETNLEEYEDENMNKIWINSSKTLMEDAAGPDVTIGGYNADTEPDPNDPAEGSESNDPGDSGSNVSNNGNGLQANPDASNGNAGNPNGKIAGRNGKTWSKFDLDFVQSIIKDL